MSDLITDVSAVSYGREIRLNTQNSNPPTFTYIAVDDNLLVQVWNSQAAQTVQVTVRLLLPDGTIVPNLFTYTPSTDRSANSFVQSLQEGFLLSITAMANPGTASGRTFVRVSLVRGYPVSTIFGEVLIQGYTGTPNALTWPQGKYERTNDGQGAIRSITGTTPAAGAEIAETVPANAIWRVIVFACQLTTSAAVASRFSSVVIDDGTHVFCQLFDPNSIPANGFVSFFYAAGFSGILGTGNPTLIQMPQFLFLPSGYRLRTSTSAIQSGDQYSPPQYLVEEWIAP